MKEKKMERNVFEKLKNLEFDGKKLSYYASWALWNKEDYKNLDYIENNVNLLNGSIVFVALNFGGKGPSANWKDWENIHGEKRVFSLLSGSRYEGAYMTDLIKNHPNPKADNLVRNLKKEEIDKNISFFFQEIDMLGSKEIEMYLFGKEVESLFNDYVMQHNDFNTFKQKIKSCQRIDHYGRRNSQFEKKAYIQLGIPKPKEEAWKYDPLW